MELVYLWVEEYKNIEKQGFNFSPKFECKYDEDTKELTIDEKKDYKSIFPDNINITAIVGENGSGKSRVLKLLIYLIYNKFNPKEKRNIPVKKAFLICKTPNGYEHLNYDIDIKKINCNQDLKELEKIDFYSIYHNYLLDTLKTDNSYDNFIDSLYHRSDTYKTPILLEPFKQANVINLNDYIDRNNEIFFEQFIKEKQPEFVKNFFEPNGCKIYFNQKKLIKKIETINDMSSGNPILKSKSIEDFRNDPKLKGVTLGRFTKKSTEEIIKDINSLFRTKKTKEQYQKINNIYFGLKILLKDIDGIQNKGFREKLFYCLREEDILTALNETIENINKRIIFESLFNEDNYNFEKKKFEQVVVFEEKILNDDKNFELFHNYINNSKIYAKIMDIKKIRHIGNYLPSWIYKEFFENEKSFDSLSSGEKHYFTFFVNIIYQLDNLLEVDRYDTINLFLDEVELSMHPNWQKRFLSDLFVVLEDYSIGCNIIITSHSPFLISDLPKENVIFLENGEQKYPFKDKQTFGANIHTLLSDGFFMDNGLMGEFAKNKINDVIEILNDKRKKSKKNIDYCKNIISLIGEPVLKLTLENMLEEKIHQNESKLERLKRKQKKLEDEIKSLENKSDE